MNRMSEIKMTQKRPGWAASLLTTIAAFALICIGIVLIAQRLDGDVGRHEQDEVAVRNALSALDDAQSALLAADYGEARALVGRAQDELEPLAEESMTQTP